MVSGLNSSCADQFLRGTYPTYYKPGGDQEYITLLPGDYFLHVEYNGAHNDFQPQSGYNQ
jgi:hypothetical protein